VCVRIINEKRRALRGEPWPLNPPPLYVEAAERLFGLGRSRIDDIRIRTSGLEENLLLDI